MALRARRVLAGQLQQYEADLVIRHVLRHQSHLPSKVQTIKNIQAMPFPNKMVWHSPGFFSLAVPYDHTRDFYYSGHTGTVAIFFIQSFLLPHRALTLFLFISLTYMVLMLTITRVHYTTDIIGGLIFSLFCHRLGTMTTYYFDWVFSFPFYVASRIREKIRQLGKEQIEQSRVISMIESTNIKHIPLEEEF